MAKSKIKIIIAIIALALVVALTAGLIAQSITISKLKQSQEQLQTTYATDENGVNMDNSSTYKMPKTMKFSAVALAANPAGISVNVTAAVEPATATNKAVDWSVMWADTTNTANVSDYVTVTPASNGSTTATITCYKAFTGDILVVVTTREGGYTADCVVSFVGKPTSLKLTSVNANKTGDKYGLGVGITYDFNISLSNAINAVGEAYKDYSVSVVATGDLTVGTYEYDPRGSKTWYNTHSAKLSDYVNDIITCTIAGETLRVTINKSIEGYYSDMVRSGSIKTYHNKVQSVDSECYFTVYVNCKKIGVSVQDTIKVAIDSSVVTGVSISGNGVIEI
ncbi:MAG: hypothetical protein K2K80_08065 [Clostridia bacterium]|nr:hypothetical protein [Clostridia bacterium]